MRNKYSNEFEEDMQLKAPYMTLSDLLCYSHKTYGYCINKKQLRLYLSKRKIRYKDYNENMKRNMGNIIPIGTEYIKPDGMVLVKVASNKWEYKQRYIYEKHYGVKLSDDIYIIFLDQDRNNFDINNLKAVSRKESAYMINQRLFFKDKDLTETGLLVAKALIKSKEILKGE